MGSAAASQTRRLDTRFKRSIFDSNALVQGMQRQGNETGSETEQGKGGVTVDWRTQAVIDLGGMKEALKMQLSRVQEAIDEVQTLTDNECGRRAWKDTRESIVSHVVQIGHAFNWCCQNPECPLNEEIDP